MAVLSCAGDTTPNHSQLQVGNGGVGGRGRGWQQLKRDLFIFSFTSVLWFLRLASLNISSQLVNPQDLV